jgi:hypothetical protein
VIDFQWVCKDPPKLRQFFHEFSVIFGEQFRRHPERGVNPPVVVVPDEAMDFVDKLAQGLESVRIAKISQMNPISENDRVAKGITLLII